MIKTYGQYSKSLISSIPADLTSERAIFLKQVLPKFPEEAIYIYSFKENKMIYADGWEEVLGYRDDEINMLQIVNITSPEYADFSNDLNDKALRFILNRSVDLEKYSFALELRKVSSAGQHIPLIVRVGVFKSENGTLTEIIGRNQINKSITLGNVMRYEAYGPEKSMFEEELNKELFRHYAISRKEKEALSLVAKGYSFKQIAYKFQISQSAVEKRILPMYKRFGVSSLTHLVTFSYENHILP